MPFNNPINSEKADRLIQLLELRPGSRALDAGCGAGEFLLRVVSRHGVRGVGVDRESKCIAQANDNAAARGLTSSCDFFARDMTSSGGTG